MTSHLVGVAEVADMLGVSRQRVNRMIQTIADFPEPEVEVAAGRIWERAAVERWINAHPVRKPGRPSHGPKH